MVMSRHANSSIYRLRPDHGVAFLDIEISMSELSRVKACFIEERISADGPSVLLPLSDDAMLDDGGAWHPETFRPLGPDDAIWLYGQQGIAPLFGHWLPLPYLRMMTGKEGASLVDHGPSNWVRIFIHPPEGAEHEASSLKAVLAIDTRLETTSRLDQRRYTTPSEEDVSLGSTFVLTDDIDQLGSFLSEAWVSEWLSSVVAGDVAVDAKNGSTGVPVKPFELEHIARYLFMLKVLCDACTAPIFRFVSHSRERVAVETSDCELILDLTDDVGLAVLVNQGAAGEWSNARSRVLPIRDLGQPTHTYKGALPIRVEFDGPPFGLADVSRRSGRSNAFNWSSLVRVGEEASRLALRPNAVGGSTGARSIARHVQDEAAIAGMWRCSTEYALSDRPGPPTRGLAMQHLSESGNLLDLTDDAAKPALRPRFSRASLLTLFVAEIVQQAVSALNVPQRTGAGDSASGTWEVLRTLRLSLPVSVGALERDAILARARESIDFVWRAEGWDASDERAPPKPAVELGLGGDFGVQLIYLHNQLNEIYGGDLTAFLEDLSPVRHSSDPAALQVVQFASICLGFGSLRTVLADYEVGGTGGIRPRLVATEMAPRGVDTVHAAIIEHVLMPTLVSAFQERGGPTGGPLGRRSVYELAGRRMAGGRAENDYEISISEVVNDRGLRLQEKILEPAARALLDLYCSLPASGTRGVERFTLKGLVAKGGGCLAPLSDQFDADAGALGAAGFRLSDVLVPFSRHAIKSAITPALTALLGAATSNIDVRQTDLIFVTSAYPDTNHLRELILSHVAVSPHRLIILDEQWGAQQDKFESQIAVPVRIGVLSSVIGKQQLLGYDGLASIEKTMQLETEVA